MGWATTKSYVDEAVVVQSVRPWSKAARGVLLKLRPMLRRRAAEMRDLMGFNLAGLGMLEGHIRDGGAGTKGGDDDSDEEGDKGELLADDDEEGGKEGVKKEGKGGLVEGQGLVDANGNSKFVGFD